jgi:hypothetical protein
VQQPQHGASSQRPRALREPVQPEDSLTQTKSVAWDMRPVHALQSMRHTRPRFETVPRPEGTYSWHWTHWPEYRFNIGLIGLIGLIALD